MNIDSQGNPDDPSLVLWDVLNDKLEKDQELKGLPGSFTRLCLTEDGRWAAMDLQVSVDQQVPVVWDVSKWVEAGRLRGSLVSMNPDGSEIITADHGSFLQWERKDLSAASNRVPIEPEPWLTSGFYGSADGRYIFYSDNAENRSHLFDLKAGKPVHSFSGYPGGKTTVAFSADGRRVLVGGADRRLRLWDCRTGMKLCEFTGHAETITSVALSPGGRRALSGSVDRTVRLWRLPP
jgi:WD40 repeat protein